MAKFEVPSIFTAVDKFSAKVNKMASVSVKFGMRTQATATRANRSFNKLFPSIGTGAKQFAQFATAGAVFAGVISGISFSTNSLIQYEKSIASLSAITGASGEDLAKFNTEIIGVAKNTNKSAIEVAKSFELIGSAKPELLGSAADLGKVSKAAIILSKASGEDLESSVGSLTDTLNQFELGAGKSAEVIDALAAGSKFGSAIIPQITESLQKFGGVAANSNVNIHESVGLIELLSKFGLKGAEAGTALRNVLSKMSAAEALPAKALEQMKKFGVNAKLVSDKTIPLNVRLKEMSKIGGDATAIMKVFGLENSIAATRLLQNTENLEKLTEQIKTRGVAEEQAAKNSNTLSVALTELSNAWVNLLVSNDAATGSLSIFMVAIQFLTRNLGAISFVVGGFVGSILLVKAALLAWRAGTIALNVAIGIHTALMKGNLFTLRGNMIAMKAYRIATIVASAAQWVASAAMTGFSVATGLASSGMAILNAILIANPIGLVIAAIAALIAFTYFAIDSWDEWGQTAMAFFGIFMPGFALIISMVMTFKKHWDNISSAFTDGGFVEGLKAIGIALVDMVITPLESILQLIAKIPGLEGIAGSGLEGLSALRESVGLEPNEDSEGVINSATAIEEQRVIRETTNNSNSILQINAPEGVVNEEESNLSNDVQLSSTMTS